MRKCIFIFSLLTLPQLNAGIFTCLAKLLGFNKKQTAQVPIDDAPAATPLAHYSPYAEREFNGGLNRVRVTQRVENGEKISHRSPINNSPEGWAALEHQSKLLDTINPNNDTPYLLKNYGKVEFSDGSSAYEMEYIEGESAYSLLNRHLPESFKKSGQKQYFTKFLAWTEVFLGSATALNKLHEEGVTHADVKLANYLVTEDGRMVIMDLSGSILRDGNNTLLAPPRIEVTYELLPPELNPKALKLDQFNFKTDEYTLCKDMESFFILLDPRPKPSGGWLLSSKKRLWKKRKTFYNKVKKELMNIALNQDPKKRKIDLVSYLQELKTTLQVLSQNEE
ncbi:MAG: hypothetical protein R3A80_02330 [Bdellovibrionota bacterium]